MDEGDKLDMVAAILAAGMLAAGMLAGREDPTATRAAEFFREVKRELEKGGLKAAEPHDPNYVPMQVL